MEKVLKVVGADLSKKSIDLAIYPAKQHLSIENSISGFQQLLSGWSNALKIYLKLSW